MPAFAARQRVLSTELSAVITRANGRREELGVINYWHRNPFVRWAYRVRRALVLLMRWANRVRHAIGFRRFPS